MKEYLLVSVLQLQEPILLLVQIEFKKALLVLKLSAFLVNVWYLAFLKLKRELDFLVRCWSRGVPEITSVLQ
jgi:hypothetical protein